MPVRKSVIILLVALCGFGSASLTLAQEKLLTLDQAIDIALQQGYQMKTLQLNLQSAEENYLSAKYRFRTNASMALQSPTWSEQLSQIQVPNGLPIYNSTGTKRFQSTLNISQPLPTDGTLTLTSQAYQSKDTNYNATQKKTTKQRNFYTSVGIRFSQPLFTYNRIQTGLKQAELNYESSRLSLNRTQLDVVYNVTSAFFSLYRQTRTLEISQETLKQRQEAYDLANLKFQAGLIPEVDALTMQVDLADAQAAFYQSESDLARQKDSFKQTLGLTSKDSVGVVTDIVFNHFDVDMDKAVQYGLQNRYEFREDEINIENRKISVITTDAQSEVNGTLSASYDFTGRSDQTLAYNSSTNSLFNSSWEDLQNRPANRGITFTLNIPIWDWGVNKAQVLSAQANLKRAQLDLEEEKKTVENNVRAAVRSVNTAETRMQVLQKSQDVAQRTYQISLDRFNTGEITSQDLALDSNRLDSAKTSYLGAYITYKLAVADLKRQTLWDFETNTSLVAK